MSSWYQFCHSSCRSDQDSMESVSLFSNGWLSAEVWGEVRMARPRESMASTSGCLASMALRKAWMRGRRGHVGGGKWEGQENTQLVYISTYIHQCSVCVKE